MTEKHDFREKQYAFARHIRDPQNHPAPTGIEDRRMAIYRELFFNNLRSLLSQTFPVLTKLHTKDKWNTLVRQFMVLHEAQTPYFLRIPQEFLQFLQNEYEMQPDDFPFLLELAHYEWAELALSVSDAVNDTTGIDPDGSLLDGIPVHSALALTFTYQFPVHRLSAEFLPGAPGLQPTCLTLCRKEDDNVVFLEMNPVTARLLEMIKSNESLTGRQLLEQLAKEMHYPELDKLIQHGLEAMEEMRNTEIVLGVK
ncbi:MAG: putative DNA-binding domain-containing protein [Proteobacteria bacterium]|nr:putative DNA-binding domain-containing protein [Pseudomonadota bacterium]MDA0992931.1 putative DNA-binding domain-containing protein [Pseudomonadota bacterium]